MPTCLRREGCRVVIYANDHPPAHVHLIGGDREAVFRLNCPRDPLQPVANYGFRSGELGYWATVLQHHIVPLCNKWRAIHG
jgi:hypothetical protein